MYRCHGAVSNIASGATSYDAHDMQAFPLLNIAFMEVQGMPIVRSEVGAAFNSHLHSVARSSDPCPPSGIQCPMLTVIDCTASAHANESNAQDMSPIAVKPIAQSNYPCHDRATLRHAAAEPGPGAHSAGAAPNHIVGVGNTSKLHEAAQSCKWLWQGGTSAAQQPQQAEKVATRVNG